METNDWKKTLKDKMSDYSEPAPAGLIDDILAAYDSAGKKRKAVIVFITGIAAAAAIAAGVFLSVDSDRGSGIPDSILAESGTITATVPVTGDTEEQGGTIQPEPSETQGSATGYTDEPVGTIQPEPSETQGSEPVRSGEGADIVAPEGEGDIAVAPEGETKNWEHLLLADAGKEETRKKPVLNIFASGITGRSSNYSGYSPAVASIASETPLKFGTNPLAGIVAMNFSEEVKTDTKHYMPVRAGVTASWEFAPKWSLESGLTYSWLLSTTRTGSDTYYIDSRQTLHYLGIPLNIGYSIWDSRWLRVYVSAGGMMEKCVGGSVKADYIHNGDIRNSETDRLRVKPLQWSVGASAGLQFNISRLVGIYVEPGVTYRFDSGADVESVYTDKPVNFNMNLGLRFSFGK